MEIRLPIPVRTIIETLQKNGYTCEVVGGAVRDLMLSTPTHDWDFTTNATPEEILPLFSDSFYENSFGTVMVAHKHLKAQFNLPDGEELDDSIYDITTYRSDGEYRNHRKPETVVWGKSIEEDLKRRDFTINAMALRVTTTQGTENIELIDPYGGKEDLEKRLIRTVGTPTERFQEDALRMLRAVRFACQLECVIEPQTLEAIGSLSSTIAHISWERISEEFMKIIGSQYPEAGVRLLYNVGLLTHIMPELVAAKGVRQSGHLIYDVCEDSLIALGTCP